MIAGKSFRWSNSVNRKACRRGNPARQSALPHGRCRDRREIVSLVEFGQSKGLSQRQSCEAVGITPRTLQNWRHAPDGDGRLDRSNFTSPRQIPEDLREQIVDRFCKADVRDLSLTQAFYKLLDENKEYWCSLSTLYRLFRARGLNARRALSRGCLQAIRNQARTACRALRQWCEHEGRSHFGFA